MDALVDMDKSLDEGALKHPDFRRGGWFFRGIKASKIFDMDKPLKDYSDENLNEILYSEKHMVKKHTDDIMFNIHLEGVISVLKRRYINNEYAERRIERYPEFFKYRPCPDCGGSRLNKMARMVEVNGKTIPELVELELTDFLDYITKIDGPIADPIVNRIKPILQNLIDIGVGYLNLNRAVGTLSGGES